MALIPSGSSSRPGRWPAGIVGGVSTPRSDLRAKLDGWSWRDSLDLLREAAASGPGGGEALAEQPRRRTNWSERLYLAAILGDASGDAGIAELRECAHHTGPHTVDLRCASLVALTKRLGPEATPILQSALSDRNGIVRQYALTCLAAFGDPSAWEAAFAELRRKLQMARKTRDGKAREPSAVYYLIRTGGPDEWQRLGTLLTESWERLLPSFQADLLAFWPTLTTGDSMGEPDQNSMREIFPESNVLRRQA